jgi:hypothetical protein
MANPYAAQIAATEQANNIPSGLLSQLLQTESGFNPNAFNPASGATGIAQILPSTAASPGYGIAPVANLNDPVSSINFAGQYLAAQYKRTGSWTGAVAAYGTVAPSGPVNAQQASLWSMAQNAGNAGSGVTGANLNASGGSLQNAAFGVAPSTSGGALTGPTGAAAAAAPGVGYPLTLGIQTGVQGIIDQITQGVKDAFTALFAGIENWVTRGFLIFIGAVLVAVAAWRLLAPNVSLKDAVALAA